MNKKLLFSATAMLPALAAAQANERPNIMLIVVDDMGYSDLECFGGEVHSPNLNGLAENGMRFTQFYNSGRSCPSRAQLLTGRYAQTVGITGMGLSLTKDCVTIPEKTEDPDRLFAQSFHRSQKRCLCVKSFSGI